MIIALRTESADPLLVLFRPDGTEIDRDSWESGRKLSGELLPHLEKLLFEQRAEWNKLTGVIVFRGPGSFTGLRIGCSVANAVAYAQNVPIVGTKGEEWMGFGLQRLQKGDNDRQVVPFYGAPPNITKPRGLA